MQKKMITTTSARIASHGRTPPSLATPSLPIVFAGVCTGCPLETTYATPLAIVIIANDATNGAIFVNATKNPVTAPQINPHTRGNNIAPTIPNSFVVNA